MVSSRKIRRTFLALLLILGGAIAYFLARPPAYEIDAESVSILGSDADLTIDKMHVVQNKQGEKSWELWADAAKIYRKENLTKLESIQIRYYPKNGKPMNITADRGTMENETRRIHIRGNVVIKTQTGYSLQTDALEFHPKEKRIDTDSEILLAGNSFRLTGAGLHGQTDLGRFTLEKNVSAVLYDIGSPRKGEGPPLLKISPEPPKGNAP